MKTKTLEKEFIPNTSSKQKVFRAKKKNTGLKKQHARNRR